MILPLGKLASRNIVMTSCTLAEELEERPLIIHQTKFDIRQWFLISSISPLMIWMYRECYLRFSTQEYTLTNHHESVHLTNHAIQKKYTNNDKRDKRLPNENMWDSYSFQAYLRQIGKQEFWFERIYPGMRQAIVAAVLVSQDHMDRTSNTFELFGADFMICENFYPWLIEINSNPDLAPTTSVTARMCPQCLEDVIKVVIDRRNDAKADVGNFELIYRQNVPPTPVYMGLNLVVKGKRLANRTNGHSLSTYIGYQRNEKSLQASQFFKQRSSLTVNNVSQAHRPMPAFNATEYIEKFMVEASTTSSHSRNVSPNSLTHLIPKHNSNNSFNSQMMGQCRAKNSNPKSTYCSSNRSTPKRHRSCGPRLITTCSTGCKDSQRPKFLVAFHNERKALLSNKNVGRTKITSLLNTPMLPCTKSLTPIIHVRRNLSNSTFRLKEQTEQDNNANAIHAVGVSISTGNKNKG